MPAQKVTRKPGIVTEAQQVRLPPDWPVGLRLSVVTANDQWQNVNDGDWIFPEPSAPGKFYAMTDETFKKMYVDAAPDAKVDVPILQLPDGGKTAEDVAAAAEVQTKRTTI